MLPFSKGALAEKLRRTAQVLKEEYRNEGIFMDVIIDISDMNTVIDYITDEEGEN